MSFTHPSSIDPQALLRSCKVRFDRRRGPGGQHRNKVETAAIIEHGPTGVTGEAAERRSQAENRRVALFRLRVNLAIEVRTHQDAPPKPTPLWTSRCRGGRIAINPKHDDFPAMLAEALDAVTRHDVDVAAAAADLECTASQLVKLLKIEHRAIDQVNRRREELGLKPLR